eukprot:scaffold612_cov343-Prasinococcus_capsulatus_cf.AAC.2
MASLNARASVSSLSLPDREHSKPSPQVSSKYTQLAASRPRLAASQQPRERSAALPRKQRAADAACALAVALACYTSLARSFVRSFARLGYLLLCLLWFARSLARALARLRLCLSFVRSFADAFVRFARLFAHARGRAQPRLPAIRQLTRARPDPAFPTVGAAGLRSGGPLGPFGPVRGPLGALWGLIRPLLDEPRFGNPRAAAPRAGAWHSRRAPQAREIFEDARGLFRAHFGRGTQVKSLTKLTHAFFRPSRGRRSEVSNEI